MISSLRNITLCEQQELAARGCTADDWGTVMVSECFHSSQLWMCRLGGRVNLGANAKIFNSTVINYSIDCDAVIDRVSLLECQGQSSFGNGVEVASLNENGGRAIKIYRSLSSQVAYMATVYRHRHTFISRYEKLVDDLTACHSSSLGYVGRGAVILGSGIIRNMWVEQDARIEGASALSNGTLLAGGYIGADVKARDFIAVEGSRIDSGTIVERCFVGENVILGNGFTAVDSLFFASSHFENGEAASIFAGPYTVSHHKSSLLIAGMFSFFNAGSGSNQSNHLLKSGPVHQGVHLRGCKFGSSAYVMLPAVNGAYTTVIGSHSAHHDTTDFPFSYLIDKDGRSTLIPASNISSCGYQRDIVKWVKRDKRSVKRDTVNMEACNPYITSMLIRAVNTTNTLIEKSPDAQSYVHNKVLISSNNLSRGLALYNKAIAAALGDMLRCGDVSQPFKGRCRWVDLGGQYITKPAVDAIMDRVDNGSISSLEAIDEALREFATAYNAYAYDYAYGILSELLGHGPSEQELQQTITAAEQVAEQISVMASRDAQRDASPAMSVSYGIDGEGDDERMADYNAVRHL